jgi:SAM-dependent methyltransferase
LKNPESDRILDLGFGNGQLLLALSRIGCKNLSGADFSESPHEKLRRAGIRLAFSNFDERFPFAETEKFDCIILNNVIEHFLDPLKVLCLAKAHLIPGGRMILITPSSNALDLDIFKAAWAGFHAPRHTFIFNHRSMEEMAKKAGFENIRIEAFNDPGQWAISCQSLMVGASITSKNQLKNGLAFYTVPLSLAFAPISIVQGFTRKSSAILCVLS